MTQIVKPFVPYQIVSLLTPNSTRRRLVEVISRPYSPSEGIEADDEVVKIRMVPCDPTTMEQAFTRDIEPITAKYRYVHVAVVAYTFEFPEDMLRYDCAAFYDHKLDESGKLISRAPMIYYLSENKQPRWTFARWQSFNAQPCHIKTMSLSKSYLGNME